MEPILIKNDWQKFAFYSCEGGLVYCIIEPIGKENGFITE